MKDEDIIRGVKLKDMRGTGSQGEKGDTGATGPKGDQGEPGIQGIKGDTGDKGDQGIQGLQGVQGLKGDTGTNGTNGSKGDQGIQGVKGDPGINGAKGDQGFQGIQGAKGDKGDKGNQGDTGARGLTGDSRVKYQSTIDVPAQSTGIYTVPPFNMGPNTFIDKPQVQVTMESSSAVALFVPRIVVTGAATTGFIVSITLTAGKSTIDISLGSLLGINLLATSIPALTLNVVAYEK